MSSVDTPIAGEQQRTITIVQVGAVRQIAWEEGMTIAQAIKSSGMRIDASNELRLNNRVLHDQDTQLQAGDQLMVVGRVAGG